jgi:glycosyltransferase involved in cell wall biosynthesis
MSAPSVLMLGWEFPPFITGGLGTACHGLTRALKHAGCDVTFILPLAVDQTHASHVRLVSPTALAPAGAISAGGWTASPAARIIESTTGAEGSIDFHPNDSAETTAARRAALLRGTPQRIDILRLRSANHGAYGSVAHRTGALSGSHAGAAVDGSTPTVEARVARLIELGMEPALAWEQVVIGQVIPEAETLPAHVSLPLNGGYGGDLILAAERYAQFCVQSARELQFDIIHAHDWLTYPAGLALARLTGRPLVVHVHATEFDRSGTHVNQQVYNIERRGMHGAVRVMAVSNLTRNLLVNRYGLSPNKIDVVYNGVELEPASVGIKRIERGERIVLYFGRITMQKGPEYFVRAAKRVLEVEKNVRFVVAGSGDLASSMIEMAAGLGIGGKMTFTGFLRGRDIPRVFSMADLYVMPSVSEPFGIAPLEAMGHRVPVIISRNSGVSEVLTHALKVDFWDVDGMANKIVAVLRHPPLRAELRDRGLFEVRGITWDGAAKRCIHSYEIAMNAVRRAPSHPRRA